MAGPLLPLAIVASSLISAFGGKQKAPPQAAAPKIDIGQSAREATTANLQGFADNARLSRMTNDFNQAEATRLLDKAIPGFSSLQARLTGMVNEDLNSQNKLPAEIEANIARLAAEKGISRGTSGGFNDFSLVRDFGFNMVDWKNAQRARALNTLSSVFGMAPRVNPMTPMSMFVQPNAALGAQQFNEQSRYNAEQGAYNAQTAASNYNRQLKAQAFSNILMAGANAFGANKPAVSTTNSAPAAMNWSTPQTVLQSSEVYNSSGNFNWTGQPGG